MKTNITKYMTQEELIYQCLFVASCRNENINYLELKEMYHKIDFPKTEIPIGDQTMVLHDHKSDLWLEFEPVRKKIKELEQFYN